MAKVVTTLEICENANLARDLALTGELIFLFGNSSSTQRILNLHMTTREKMLALEYVFGDNDSIFGAFR